MVNLFDLPPEKATLIFKAGELKMDGEPEIVTINADNRVQTLIHADFDDLKSECSEYERLQLSVWVDPVSNVIRADYFSDSIDGWSEKEYAITNDERELVLAMISDKVQELYGCTPSEWAKREASKFESNGR